MPPIVVCLFCNIVLRSYSTIFDEQQIFAKLDIFISIYKQWDKKEEKKLLFCQ